MVMKKIWNKWRKGSKIVKSIVYNRKKFRPAFRALEKMFRKNRKKAGRR